MIKIRLDVDYAYPSRPKSFFFTFLSVKVKKNYLKNAKIIARMINESPKEVKAYWFFTPRTTPDKEMQELMRPDRHEVALHVTNNPEKELKELEKATNRKIEYYTIHGTERLLGQIIWKRKLGKKTISVPEDFPLENFWNKPTMILDRVCHAHCTSEAIRMAEENIQKGEVLHIHPDWIFNRGKFNHRGPYYDALKVILEVDKELDGLSIRKKSSAKIASYTGTGKYSTLEYEQDFVPTKEFEEKLADRGVDIFTFIERSWCFKLPNPPKNWLKTKDNGS